MGEKVLMKMFVLNKQAREYFLASSLTSLGLISVFSLGFHVSLAKYFCVLALNALLYLTVLTGNRKSYRFVLVLNAIFALIYLACMISQRSFSASTFVYLLLCQLTSTFFAYICYRLLEDRGLAKLEQIVLG